MLDAGASVQYAANSKTLTAFFHPSSSSIRPGNAITLDANCSTAATNDAITAYSWSISKGSDLARLDVGTDASMPSLSVYSTGTVEVTLTLTTASGLRATSAQSINVTGASNNNATTGTYAPGATSTTSGGGASSASDLLALLGATLALVSIGAVSRRSR